MEFFFRYPKEQDIKSIARWQYDPPYSQYNGQYVVGPVWKLRLYRFLRFDYYVVDDEHGNLIGTFTFQKLAPRKVIIGLGMRPDLTGQGHGLAFVQAGLAFARKQYNPRSFHLNVAPFNKRAMKVYKRAGFEFVASGKEIPKRKDLWEMRRDA